MIDFKKPIMQNMLKQKKSIAPNVKGFALL